jgi:hypothetical protein
MQLRRLTVSAAFLIFLTASSACAAPTGRVYVRVGPPAPVAERVAVAPGPGYVWVPGYYVHNGAAYVWRPGVWVVPPRRRAVWVAPHWQHERRGWFFVEGHWR